MMFKKPKATAVFGITTAVILAVFCIRAEAAATHPRLRAVGVPAGVVYGPEGEAQLRIMEAFKARHPGLELIPATGINIPGKVMDTQPLMQIAGDVSPDVIYVNFRQSDTYIENKFLFPLDEFIERTAGVDLPTGPFMSTDEYYAELSKGPNFDSEIRERMPRILWDVVRRECPYGNACPYLKKRGIKQGGKHYHVWAVPREQIVLALFYRKDIFAEAGLPDRVPETLDELLDWARKTTNPKDHTFGLNIPTDDLGWRTLAILYSYGGRVVNQDENGDWRCVFDSPEAVDAYSFVAKLFLEPFTNAHGEMAGTVGAGDLSQPDTRFAMWFAFLSQHTFGSMDPGIIGFGPVPKGPNGIRGSEYNCMMYGIYAGNADNDRELQELAWDYLWFCGGKESDQIYAKTFVENGVGRFVRPSILINSGYIDAAQTVPKGWEEAYQSALTCGIPEPYGRNCQLVYQYVTRGIDQIIKDGGMRKLFRNLSSTKDPKARAEINGEIREKVETILENRVNVANEKMLGHIPENVRRFRNRVAAAVIVMIIIAFAIVFRMVFKVFNRMVAVSGRRGVRPLERIIAYLLLLPTLATIAIWSYWPLMRGTIIAFQNYNVRGFSQWIGLDNFAFVLFNAEFWHSIYISLCYTGLSLAFGFAAPIILAILLSEVPRGKILFRTIYYLPAVLSGVVVIFLWKGFYGQYGMINQLLNKCIVLINSAFGTQLETLTTDWLWHPRTALLCCLLPTIWAGAGPGCLIYLAALKTVPDDLYEAADIDGAGIFSKIRHITLPSIKMLIIINFIGALIGSMRSGSDFILAMTGGGPYTPYGQTEVVGLHIFWEAFGYLRFGSATAMAWVLGAMLIGFTVHQLQYLSKMEFRTTGD